MTGSLIISLCALLLLAYVFDISSSRTRIPSVILLLALGWAVRQGFDFLNIHIPDLTPILPVIGTIGLILIVLEGSLELELDRSKLPFVGKASLIAFLPMIIISLVLAFAFQYYGVSTYKIALANAIPLAIISSAIAIPSAKNLISRNREFITYESSLSDIFGVIFFNFITLNAVIGAESIGRFFLNLMIILVVAFIATLGLTYLLNKITNHVKFIPIILMVVLIYAVAKHYHLPALVFILLFGIFLKNLEHFKQFQFIQKLHPELLKKEVHRFKELTVEMAFLVRALFFLLFGYLIEAEELLNPQSFLWAGAITLGIFLLRSIFLLIFKFPLRPLLFIAPRGLITILLFLSIPVGQNIPLVNNSLVIQVIVLTALFMMLGLMTNGKTKAKA